MINYVGDKLREWIASSLRRYLVDPNTATMYQNYFTDRKSPVYVDIEDLWLVYMTIPHLRAVIDRKAEMFANCEIEMYDTKTGEKIEKHPVLDLLNNPNPLQKRELFLRQISTHIDVYTTAFINKVSPAVSMSGIPKVMYALPPEQMRVVPTGKIYKQFKLDGIVKEFVMTNGDEASNQPFKPDEIIWIRDSDSINPLLGESKIKSLQKPISNIDGALKTRNIIIYDRGALGILSNESKDETGAIPLGKDERERIEREYRERYGIRDGQMRLTITNAALKWQSMTFPTKDLMLFEEIEDDFATICAAYGMARDIFPSVKGATFENQKEAVIQTYQNTIIPFADLRMREFTTAFGLDKENKVLKASYDWLPVMQGDELSKNQSKQAEESARQTQQSTIIALNAAISAGQMTREKALELLYLQGYSQDQANKLV